MNDPFGELPRKVPASHSLGEDLSALSVHELDERIGLLQQEILRLQEARVRKEASRDAAAAIFKL